MDILYKTIENLCQKKNVTVTTMCKESGVPRSALSDFKAGRIKSLSADKLQKIAKYFDVTVDYLLGKTYIKKTPTLTEKDERDIARDLESIMNALEQGGDMMFDGDPMSDEARDSIIAAMRLGLQAAKLKNKERFTPKKYRKE